MTNRELSAWASALVTLLKNGLTDEAVKILEGVIIKQDEEKRDKKQKDNKRSVR